jgi:hypothetical protein
MFGCCGHNLRGEACCYERRLVIIYIDVSLVHIAAWGVVVMLSQILSISRVLILALLLVTLTPAGWSQQTTVQSVLAPAVWSDTQIRATGVTWPVDCHSSSGVYFRQPSGGESWTFAPITALLPSGQSQVFDLRAATNYQQPVLGTTFYVNAQGTIYAAIQIGRETQWYIAQYDRAGTFVRRTALPARFMPSFLLSLPEDRLLVGGTFARSSGKETHVKSLVAIFDKDGNQLKSLSLPEDDSAETVVKEEAVKQLYYTVRNPAIEGGKAVLADDGNVYILRASEKPVVQVVNPKGDTLRTFVLEPGNAALLPTVLAVYKDSVAVGYFWNRADNICPTAGQLILYSPQSGNVITRYSVKLSPMIFVCAQGRDLVYLTNPKGTQNYKISRVSIPISPD